MSGLQIRSAWRPLDRVEADRLEPATGVYELRAEGRVQRIAYAGARSQFGLRGELRALAASSSGVEFRVEVTSAYLSRWHELLAAHLADHGCLPPGNDDERERPRGLRPIGMSREVLP